MAAEAGNEIMDRIYFGSWRWSDTLGDVANTLFWPAFICLLPCGYGRSFGRGRPACAKLGLRTPNVNSRFAGQIPWYVRYQSTNFGSPTSSAIFGA